MDIKFEPIELKHKQMLEEYFKKNRVEISEFNYTEMFIWRKIRNNTIGFINENICVRKEKYGKKILYKPFGNNNIRETIKLAFDNGICDMVYGWTLEELKSYNFEDEYEIENDRANFDYVYLTRDLINLEGRKYDGKRNHVKKFKQLNYKICEITDDMLEKIKQFQKKWCEDRLCRDDMSLKNESMAINELLTNFTKLSIFGAAIFINDNIEGYTVADKLNEETALIIVEKANPQIKGIYQGLNQIFAEKFLYKYKYINREQDMGIEGLRKAKISYHPHHFVEKLIIRKAV